MKINDIINEFLKYNPRNEDKGKYFQKQYVDWFLENSKKIDKININYETEYDLYYKKDSNNHVYFIMDKNELLGFIVIVLNKNKIYTIKLLIKNENNKKSNGVSYALMNYLVKDKGYNLLSDNTLSNNMIRVIDNLISKSNITIKNYDSKTEKLYDLKITSQNKKISDDNETIILNPYEEENNRFDYNKNGEQIDRGNYNSRFYWFFENQYGMIHYPKEHLKEYYEHDKKCDVDLFSMIYNSFDYVKYEEDNK